MKTRSITMVIMLSLLSVWGADEVDLEITRSVKVTFQSEEGKSYQLLSSEDAEKTFQAIGEPVAGNGGKITVFYESEDDQKVFFKVEETKADFAINDWDRFKKVELASLYRIGNPLHELRVKLPDNDYSGFILQAYDFANLDIAGTNFSNCTIINSSFKLSDLSNCNFSGTIFVRCEFILANMEKANFENAVLIDCIIDGDSSFTARYKGIWNESSFTSDLQGIKLANLALYNNGIGSGRLNFRNLDLWNSDFSNSWFVDCDFTGAILNEANFSNIIQVNAIFSNASFIGANLTGSLLHGAKFDNAVLTNADLTGATGFNPDQEGIIFNNTTMPDGTVRTD